jgi:hypothetical protein
VPRTETFLPAELPMARSGQALVEYVLVIALAAIALGFSILLFQRVLGERIEDVSSTVETVVPRDPSAPPGQGGNRPPGHGGTPPGQGGTPPGQGGTPPGQGGTPPGQGGDGSGNGPGQ